MFRVRSGFVLLSIPFFWVLPTTVQASGTSKSAKEMGISYQKSYAKKAGVKRLPSGLLYKIERPGKGAHPRPSDRVTVDYQGTLVDGKVFDSSYRRHHPATFRLDQVIPGWTQGLTLIGKGGKVTLVIPPKLAYGKQDMGIIPPNSTLIFQVELLDINP